MDTGHRLVHTSAQPIIDQLPGGEVDHLLLYAPFHDERTDTVRELIARLRPARVTLAVQSGGRTVIQPTALRRVIAAAGIPVAIVEDSRGPVPPRDAHRGGPAGRPPVGPDRQPRPDGARPAHAGRQRRQYRGRGGVAPGGEPVPRATRPLSLEEVPAARQQPGSGQARQSDSAVLLAATRAGDGLEVTLARPTTWPTPLEASRTDSPGAWAAIGSVPADAVSHLLAGTDLPGGTRVRRARDAGGAPGPAVFVMDSELAVHGVRGQTAPDPVRGSPGPAELITDARLLERWLTNARLADGRRPGRNRPRAPPTRRTGWPTPTTRRPAWASRCTDSPSGELPSGLPGPALAAARDRPGPERRKVRQLLTTATGTQAAPRARHRPPCPAHPRAVRVGGEDLGRPAGGRTAGSPPARRRSETWSAATYRSAWSPRRRAGRRSPCT